MGYELQIDIRDAVTPELEKIMANVRDRTQLHGSLGGRAERALRDHFARREAEPNKRGWPKQHFWDQIRSATALGTVDGAGATITINDERLAQKIYGGTIRPGLGKKYLAIPEIAEASGISPKSLTNLRPLVRYVNGERRAVALVERKASAIKYGRKRKDGTRKITQTASILGGAVWYWLVKSVTQRKDERALPDAKGFRRELIEQTREYFKQFSVR